MGRQVPCRLSGREFGRRATRILSTLLIAGGFAALLAVNGADWYAQLVAERHIESFMALYDDENDPERLEYKRQAIAYNEWLSGKDADMDLLGYREQLFYQHEPMMSYIEIPKISVRQPIYHGTADTELMAGVGHLETSSLPIGGETSHCVLLGHSGMRNARMFDDLKRLAAGDEFVVWTLNEPYAYRVFSTEVVLPEEAEERTGLVEGRDIVTLVTCTPYGINSHRLLVHAQRCEYVAEEVASVGLDAYVNDRNLPLIAAMIAVGAVGAGGAAMKAASKRRRREDRLA